MGESRPVERNRGRRERGATLAQVLLALAVVGLTTLVLIVALRRVL